MVISVLDVHLVTFDVMPTRAGRQNHTFCQKMPCSVFVVKTKPFIVDTCPFRSEKIFAPWFQWAQKKLTFFGPLFRYYASKLMTNAVKMNTRSVTKCTLTVKNCLGRKNQTIHRRYMKFQILVEKCGPISMVKKNLAILYADFPENRVENRRIFVFFKKFLNFQIHKM